MTYYAVTTDKNGASSVVEFYAVGDDGVEVLEHSQTVARDAAEALVTARQEPKQAKARKARKRHDAR